MTAENNISLRRFITVAGIPGYVLFGRQIIMSLISRQRAFDEVATVDASAVIQISMAGTAFLVGINSLRKDSFLRTIIARTPMQWFLIYSFWALFTSFWSINGLLSAYRAFECIAWFILIAAVLSRVYANFDNMDVIRWIVFFAVFAILFNTLNRARQFGFSVFSLDTLRMEQMWSTPFFFIALLLPVGWFSKVFLVPLSIFSLSNTAYAGMAGGLLALFKGTGNFRKVFILSLFAILLIISIIGTEKLLKSTIFYGKKGVGIEYTTGRDKIVMQALNEARNKPIIGYGFVAGEIYLFKSIRKGIIGTHNGFLSAQLGTGLIGTIFFLIFMIRIMIVSGSKYLPNNIRVSFLATTILITVHTLGNPGLGSRVYGTWIPAMLVFTTISVIQLHYKSLSEYEDSLGHS